MLGYALLRSQNQTAAKDLHRLWLHRMAVSKGCSRHGTESESSVESRLTPTASAAFPHCVQFEAVIKLTASAASRKSKIQDQESLAVDSS